MRGLVLLTALSITLAHAAINDYTEERDLTLPAEGIDQLRIDAGAGDLRVEGDAASADIRVAAIITVQDADAAEAQRTIEEDVVLQLGRAGNEALLEAHAEQGWFGRRHRTRIDLVVRIPRRLALTIDDGSGGMDIAGIDGRTRIDDGSGSLFLSDVGADVRIDDGSGAIDVRDVAGDLQITDGSGSIIVRQVTGTVTVDDGSGSIDVSGIGRDFVVLGDGSGRVRYSAVQGIVDLDEHD